ncbi:hypothetical protein N0V90_004077 [Kalmusia sp. IMI 367209]|nr:hypothetical protein N0V90_004077 [Kalmusia sp. IMI 367209]
MVVLKSFETGYDRLCETETIGVLAVIRLLIATHASKSNAIVSCNCGYSIQEAIANGCKYDPMATSWLPAACRDDELIDQFNHAGPGPNGEWSYYKTQAGNDTYTLEEVAMLAEKTGDEASFWTTHEWHIGHCLFYWRKESRARVSGKVAIETSFTGDYHVSHCEEVLKSCRPLDEINTRSSAGLNSDLNDDGTVAEG